MTNWIERYVSDVIRRLPEKEREDVGKELRANIGDMLPDGAEEADVKAVLYRMGPPSVLAEQYRQNPRYLISPAIYDAYVRALQWILPLVGTVVLAIGMILGGIQAIQGGEMVSGAKFISSILSSGISMGVSAALQALVWTTVGFAIAERVGAGTADFKKLNWKLEDLPAEQLGKRNEIALNDSIFELVATVIFSLLGILFCSGAVPFTFIIEQADIRVYTLFSPTFLSACIPALAVMAALSVLASAVKIKTRRWTPLVCGAVIIDHLLSTGITLYMFLRPDMFSAEFTAFLKSVEWGSLDLLRFMGKGNPQPVLLLVCAIIVIISLAECGKAIVKTLRNNSVQMP